MLNKPQKDGKSSRISYAGQYWHSDKSYTRTPSKASLLLGVEVPAVGGDTMFTNCYLTYETLSDGMKKLIEELHGAHIRDENPNVHRPDLLDRSSAERLLETQLLTRTAQPIVRVHPETGRKALFLGAKLIRNIVGMTAEESAPLLQYLHEHATRPQFVYRHAWQNNDVVICDNRCTMHLAVGDYDSNNQVRHLEKTTVAGTPSGYVYPLQ